MPAPPVFQEMLDSLNEAFAYLEWERTHAAALAKELSKPPAAPGGLFSAPPVPLRDRDE